MKKIYISLLLVLVSAFTFAQGTVTGTVQDGGEGEALIGAIVRIDGTSLGSISDIDGTFTIDNVAAGNYNLQISSVGFDTNLTPIVIVNGQTLNVGAIVMKGGSLALQGVEIIADIAIDRKTPVAVSNISGEYIEQRTGNQELPMVLSTAPSVYASQESGGYGDSNLTVRGFDDENVVVLVNGVAVNDLENNSLFWSNWTGLQDVASRVQIQRGLGASLLAVPSIGGTVNIISKATDNEKGGWASASIGNDLYRKYGLQLSTGDMNGFAVTFAGSRTTGDGYVDGNFIDAYSYFGSITKDWANHTLALTAFGAPQKHGQGFNGRRLNQFVAAPGGEDYEEYIGDSKAHDFNTRGALVDNGTGSANSIRYNSGWGYTNYDVNRGYTQDGMFNQFSNFYHKPQVSLSDFWDVSDKVEILSTLYGSWGRGGGASSWGNLSPFGYQASNATGSGGPVNWDSLIADNIANNPDGLAGENGGDPYYFFRASMNHHNYYGLTSKAIIDLSDVLALSVGIDTRIYSADHVRKIIDLFGLSGFQHSDFASGQQTSVADNSLFGYSDNSTFNRDNTGKVNWLGGFSELEYSNDKFTASLGGSISNKAYKKIQRLEGIDGESDFHNFLGGAVKTGANYNVTNSFNVYGNAGYLSIQPIFDNVFQGGNNGGVTTENIFDDAANEKVLSFELGTGITTPKFAANLNGYYTKWQDKAITVFDDLPNGDRIFGNAFGVDALHKGIEIDLVAQPVKGLEFTGAASFGDWNWENNSTYQLFDQSGNLASEGGYFIKDVKVGSAPQTQVNVGGSYTAPFGLGMYAGYQHNLDYYAGFQPENRQDPNLSGVNSNKLPDFGLTNIGVSYDVDMPNRNSLRFNFNMNNLFDVLYVNRAQEDVSSNSDGTVITYANLERLRGNFGLGRTWNAGVKLNFSGEKPKAKVVEVIMPAEPIIIDRDNDGVIDAADKCPDTPGSLNGCPDRDGDGVMDNKDNCPEIPGTNMGCPEIIEEIVEVEVISIPDADGDGVIDSKDNCPDVFGSLYNAGCPEVDDRPTPEIVKELNFIARSVLFNFDSDVIHSDSKPKLDDVATIMLRHPNTMFVVEGHTDSVGVDAYNKTLSQKRAQSVVNYLITKGVNSSNLTSIGYGEERPIASNDTKEGRHQNRRVVISLGN